MFWVGAYWLYHEDPWVHDEYTGVNDLSDDAWVLASAGMGTDEDYGCYGNAEDGIY